MTKLLIAGDTHGVSNSVISHIKQAVEFGCQAVVVVGDFGLWPGFGGVSFLDDINAVARRENRTIIAIPGNHDDYDQWEWHVENSPKSNTGFAYIRDHVVLVPKVHQWKWGQRRFASVGGAVSIDKEWRLMDMRHGSQKLWWEQEQLTDAQVAHAKKLYKPDYLFTHDCSDKTPFRDRLKPDPDSKIHRQKIDEILKATKPGMHFHGHMHTKYDWENLVDVVDGEPVYVQTYGLDCNNDTWAWGVLDTDENTFKWRGRDE